MQEDRRVIVVDVAQIFDISAGTAFNILHSEFGLTKKSVRWVPKLLSVDTMRCRVKTARQILRLDSRQGLAFQLSVITMDETIFFHTPEVKERSKQWLSKGSPGPVKAKVIAPRKSRSLLLRLPRPHLPAILQGTSINGDFTIEALKKFLAA